LDAYAATFDQEKIVGQAVTRLADKCLIGKNLTAGPVFLGHITTPASEVDESAVQWISVPVAQKYGFNVPQTNIMKQYEDTAWTDGGIFGLSAAVSRVFYGTCLGNAAAEVTKGIGTAALLGNPPQHMTPYTTYYELVWPGLPIQLEEQAVNETEADPRAAAVASAWHSCMLTKGYGYATPAEALADPRWAPGTATSESQVKNHALQISVAIADARCQQKVNFGGMRLALLTAYQNQLIRAHEQELKQYVRQVATLVARARKILKGRNSLSRPVNKWKAVFRVDQSDLLAPNKLRD
jgi:hypothetical protein